MTNLEFAERVLRTMHQWSVSTFCLAPGGRNAPFVEALFSPEFSGAGSSSKDEEDPHPSTAGHSSTYISGVDTSSECHLFYDERAASFFALGRSRRDKTPVAVVTTSGTAVSQLLSAAVEAKYSQTPLVLITCDRPVRYRGSGAPQVVNQLDYLGSVCEAVYDIQCAKDWLRVRPPVLGPIHINVCFDKPLIKGLFPEDRAEGGADSAVHQIVNEPRSTPPLASNSLSTEALANEPRSTEPLSDGQLSPERVSANPTSMDKTSFLNEIKKLGKPLLLLSQLNADEKKWVRTNFKHWEGHYFLEGEDPQPLLPKAHRILEGRTLMKALSKGLWDGVLRVGAVPVHSFWRHLDTEICPVYSLSSLQWSGLPGGKVFWGPSREWPTLGLSHWSSSQLREWDEKSMAQRKTALERFPRCEAAFFQALTEKIPSGQPVFLGNSLPIRQWLEDGAKNHFHTIGASRGANGIDGQLATALGWAIAGTMTFAIVGDLTFLYDLNALSLRSLNTSVGGFSLVVVNNGGGKIFETLFTNATFINPQNFDLEALAHGMGWSYQRFLAPHEISFAANTGFHLIELRPDAEESFAFRREVLNS